MKILNAKNKLKGFLLEVFPENILINIKKIHYCYQLRKFSNTNEPDFNVLRYLIKKGDRVIDIGANVGWYTKFLSEITTNDGQVISLEPIPSTFKILSYCIKNLSLTNVKLLNFAISDKEGSVKMEIPKYDFGGYNYYRSRIINDCNKEKYLKYIFTNTKTLDSITKNFDNNLSFIKCDVEGHELAVIKGALKTISKFKPSWMIEINSDLNGEKQTFEEIFNIMYQNGYSAYWFDGKKLNNYSNDGSHTNYFFLTHEHLNKCILGGIYIKPLT